MSASNVTLNLMSMITVTRSKQKSSSVVRPQGSPLWFHLHWDPALGVVGSSCLEPLAFRSTRRQQQLSHDTVDVRVDIGNCCKYTTRVLVPYPMGKLALRPGVADAVMQPCARGGTPLIVQGKHDPPACGNTLNTLLPRQISGNYPQ